MTCRLFEILHSNLNTRKSSCRFDSLQKPHCYIDLQSRAKHKPTMSHPDQPKVLERRWRSETPNESDPDDAGTGLTGSSSPTRTFSGALAETANINRRTGDAELAKLVDLFQKLGLSTSYANLPIALNRVLVISCQECQRWSWCVLRSDSFTTKRCLRCGSSETATSSKSCERSPNAVRVLERQPESVLPGPRKSKKSTR